MTFIISMLIQENQAGSDPVQRRNEDEDNVSEEGDQMPLESEEMDIEGSRHGSAGHDDDTAGIPAANIQHGKWRSNTEWHYQAGRSSLLHGRYLLF
jgi:hypothetical protein